MSEYKRLDFSALKFSGEVKDMAETLKDIKSFDLKSSMIRANKELKVKAAEKDEKNRCVKLVI